MNPDGKHERVRRCATCGEFVGITQLGECPRCSGPLITLGPIEWTEVDEKKAMEDFGEVEDDGDRFQDVVCMLWDKIEGLEAKLADKTIKGKVKKSLGVTK